MVKQVIVVRKKYPTPEGSLKKAQMGKLAAQIGHAASEWLIDLIFSNTKFTKEQKEWAKTGRTKVCLRVDTLEELNDIQNSAQEAGLLVYEINDLGKTEFGGECTKTCISIGPHEDEKIDSITKGLSLL